MGTRIKIGNSELFITLVIWSYLIGSGGNLITGIYYRCYSFGFPLLGFHGLSSIVLRFDFLLEQLKVRFFLLGTFFTKRSCGFTTGWFSG